MRWPALGAALPIISCSVGRGLSNSELCVYLHTDFPARGLRSIISHTTGLLELVTTISYPPAVPLAAELGELMLRRCPRTTSRHRCIKRFITFDYIARNTPSLSLTRFERMFAPPMSTPHRVVHHLRSTLSHVTGASWIPDFSLKLRALAWRNQVWTLRA
jgi:hypothetical protein